MERSNEVQPENNANANPFDNKFIEDSGNSVIGQLDMVIRRGAGDDLNTRAVENARSAMQQFMGDLNARFNYEADEYNSAVDAIEERDAYILTLTKAKAELEKFKGSADKTIEERVSAVMDELDDTKATLSRVTFAHEQDKAKFDQETTEYNRLSTLGAIQLRTAKAELAEYRKENPPTQKAEIATLTAEIGKMRATRKEDSKLRQEIQTALNAANSDAGKYRRRISVLEIVIANTKEENQHLASQVKELAAVIVRTSGGANETIYTTKADSGHLIDCYISTYPCQSQIRLHDRYTERDYNHRINCHWQVRTASMIDMTVVASPWGRALMFILPHLANEWNLDITNDLEKRIENLYSSECPMLYKRMMDGQDAPISELKLSKRTEKMLVGQGFNNVREVGSILTPDFEYIKGCGEASATEITNALIAWETEWEAINGPVEEYRRSKLVSASPRAEMNRSERRKQKSLTK